MRYKKYVATVFQSSERLKRIRSEERIRSGDFLHDEHGATAIEYGLIAAGIAIAIVLIVFAVGDSLTNVFGRVWLALDFANQGGF